MSTSGKLAWGFVAALAVIHYDFWNWHDTSTVFGFMPVGLFYHAVISLAAGLAWFLVVRHAWPTWLEQWASDGKDPGEPGRDDPGGPGDTGRDAA